MIEMGPWWPIDTVEVAASIAFLFRAYFIVVLDTIAPLSCV